MYGLLVYQDSLLISQQQHKQNKTKQNITKQQEQLSSVGWIGPRVGARKREEEEGYANKQKQNTTKSYDLI